MMSEEANTNINGTHPEEQTTAKRISAALNAFLHVFDRQLKAVLTRKPVRFILYFLLGYWALGSDPLGLSTASDKAISDELARLGAYLAPSPPAPITVVAIDHDSIEGLHNQGKGWLTADDWPLTYVDHGRILRDLVLSREKPAAVFYDIFFEKPRAISGDMTRLGRLLSRLQEQPEAAPLLLSGGGSFMPMSPEAYQALGRPPLAVTAWEGHGDFYPLHAPLSTGGDSAGAANAPMAATALYQALCARRGQNCDWLAQPDQPNLAVQWELVDKPGCGSSDAGHAWARVARDLFNMLGRAIGFGDALQPPPASCLPFHQVRLADLYADEPASLRPPHLKPGEPFVVLVGVVMPSMKDYLPSPLYGLIEGVYLHAAALENLQRHGASYIHEHDITSISQALLMLLIAAAMHVRRYSNRTINRILESEILLVVAIRWLAWWFLLCAVVVALYCAFYLVWRIAPEGWLTLIALAPLLREVVLTTESKYDTQQGERHEERTTRSHGDGLDADASDTGTDRKDQCNSLS
tara:strand:+ start:23551 stop:25122 length:1572 start_codon:yes stop_codon:yes gene_type:complete